MVVPSVSHQDSYRVSTISYKICHIFGDVECPSVISGEIRLQPLVSDFLSIHIEFKESSRRDVGFSGGDPAVGAEVFTESAGRP